MAIKKFYVYVNVVGGEDGVVAIYKELEKIPGYRNCGVQRPDPGNDKKTLFDICYPVLATIGGLTLAGILMSFLSDGIIFLRTYFGG